MSRVARLIKRIENEMGAESEASAEENMSPEREGNVDPQHLRMTEALLFAASEPLDAKALATSLPAGADVPAILSLLQKAYEDRGVSLVRVAEKWQFRTAPDLTF